MDPQKRIELLATDKIHVLLQSTLFTLQNQQVEGPLGLVAATEAESVGFALRTNQEVPKP